MSKAAATERQKRFNLLNSQFNKREASLQKVLDEERAAGASIKAELQQLAGRQMTHDEVQPLSCSFCDTTL